VSERRPSASFNVVSRRWILCSTERDADGPWSARPPIGLLSSIPLSLCLSPRWYLLLIRKPHFASHSGVYCPLSPCSVRVYSARDEQAGRRHILCAWLPISARSHRVRCVAAPHVDAVTPAGTNCLSLYGHARFDWFQWMVGWFGLGYGNDPCQSLR